MQTTSAGKTRRTILLVIGLIAVMNFDHSNSFADDKLSAEQTKFFESKIRPVLVRECYSCHSNQVGQVKGGLWLDSKEALRIGGDSGPAIVPANLGESTLWNAINHLDFEMPPRRKLSDEILQDFRTWIEMGAPDPRVTSEENIRTSITPENITTGREFWSFKPPQRPVIPTLSESNWPRTEIDYFVLEKLSENGLQPASDADPNTLLRRLCFDLTGLPPTPKQIGQFKSAWTRDPDQAIEKIVDELLARPEYGERWGRHWLDVARYAESSGRELNLTFPHAWRYRDYVIDSFNQDKPYNQFVIEQLAGDLLPIQSDEEWAENLVATGFLAVGPKGLREQNPRQFELDLVDEQIDVTTRVLLGVSVACARCHDHKFDPIPQTDYYALAGIFRGMSTHYGTAGSLQNRRPSNLIVLPVEDLNPNDQKISKKQLDQLKSDLVEKQAELREALRARASRNNDPNNRAMLARIPLLSATVSALESQINSVDLDGNPLTFCMAVQETSPMNSRLLERGELNKPAQVVERGFPQVLCSNPPTISTKSTGRLEFARWVGSFQNPLTARVMANRIWQHLFVNGIVRTPDDFASTGEQPTHPELLDYLAVSLMENDWSIKQLVRSIVLSRAYRMNGQFSETRFLADPENKLLWRMEPRRLEAEAIRDSMLAIGGNLDTKRPRASLVAIAGNAQVNNGRIISVGRVNESMPMQNGPQMGGSMMSGSGSALQPRLVALDQSLNYRSVYLPIVRENIPRSLEVFDFAESTLVISQRETSNTPDQGLYFMNNHFVIDQSDAMARRLLGDSKNLNQQIKSAFLWAYGRPATDDELKAVLKFHSEFQVKPSYQSLSKTTNSSSLNEMRARRNQNSRNQNGRNPGVRPNPYVDRNRVDPIDPELLKLSAVCQAILGSAEFRIVN